MSDSEQLEVSDEVEGNQLPALGRRPLVASANIGEVATVGAEAVWLKKLRDGMTVVRVGWSGNFGAKRRTKRTCLYMRVDCPTAVLAVEFR